MEERRRKRPFTSRKAREDEGVAKRDARTTKIVDSQPKGGECGTLLLSRRKTQKIQRAGKKSSRVTKEVQIWVKNNFRDEGPKLGLKTKKGD